MKALLKKLASVFCVFVLFSALFCASAITLNTVETDVELKNSVTLLMENSLVPGFNAFTGNTSAVTFETEDDLDYVTLAPKYDSNAKVDYQIGARDAYSSIGNSLMFRNTDGKTDASMHFVTNITFTMPVAVDRPALLVARVCDAYTQWRGGRCNDEIRTNTAGDWRNAVIIKALDGENTLDSNTFAIDVLSLDGNGYWMYIDNLAVIPYYKITYKNMFPDGNIGKDTVKYELDTSAIDVSSNDGVIVGLPASFVPSETLACAGYTFVGWSCDENAETAMKSVALENQDIVLYPVWTEKSTGGDHETPDTTVLTPGKNIFTGTGNALTMDTDADLKWVTVGPKWEPSATVDYEIGDISGFGNMFRAKNTNGVTDASGHFVVAMCFTADVTVDRPAYLIARVYDACTMWEGLGNGWVRTNTSGDWSGGYITRNYDESSIPNSDCFQFEAWAVYSNNYWMCIDNLAVIPYYKVTYKNIMPDSTTGIDIVKYELDTTNIAVTTNDGVIAGLPTSFVPSETLECAGYTFIGWSTDENAVTAMESVALENEDIVLYPVWTYDASTVIPTTNTTTEVKVAAVSGMRFTADVLHRVRQIENDVVEYGFIVTTEDHIGDYELTFNSGVKYVYGKAYSNTENIDKIYKDSDVGVTFSALMVGIPDTKDAYTKTFIARSYVKIGNLYFYGNTHSDSLYNAVRRLDDETIAKYPFLQNIINKVEG